MSVLLAHNSTIVGSLPFEGLLDWLTLQDLVSYKAYQKSNEKQRVFIVVMSTLTYLFYQLWLITGAANRTRIYDRLQFSCKNYEIFVAKTYF